MKKIGIFYSFNTKKTSLIASKIIEGFGNNIEAVNAENISEEQFRAFDNMILGVPTWFDGELPNYWDEFIPAIEEMNLAGKNIAVFGAGNQKEYPENFVDAIGIMADILESRGAKIVGATPIKGYEFESSRAKRGDKFVGLALDFENQHKLNNDRVKNWCNQLTEEFQ